MKKPYQRSHRLGDLIKQEVSRLLLIEVKDPRIGMITITDVEMSSDIKRAKIFYNVGGGEDKRRETQEGLNKASGFIRTALAQTLEIKRIPEICFEYDTSLDYGEKIDRILDSLKKES